MKLKPYFTLSLLLFLSFLTITCCAQNSSKIAGSYKFGGSLLVINADNTCMMFAENAFVKGTVEINGNMVTIKPYVPKVPFVLYGRKSESRVGGNTIMFQSFNEAKTLINFDENNNSLNKMKRAFNVNANCIPYPNVLDNPNENSKFYFAIQGKKEVYEFENNQGYRDFIVLYLPQKDENLRVNLTLNVSKDKLIYEGEILEKEQNSMSQSEVDDVLGMYNRAYSESENYYCNPAYNFFEMKGIDVNSGQYKKEEYAGAYYFIDKYNEAGDDKDYHNTSKIYEYQKVNPKVLINQPYTVENSSVFIFNCGKE
ncbi:hypothetical protein EZJ43_08050 [Pedobacter changchengzhani]|uniref:DUF4369 domain-containing protein n=1 Tax=Pedobacter changchengzhani TaxID=2529274 RepID=A0A4R5MLA7_9SPHI|nr:hypothetical protein [Pedobacter changchengzhani]TDG36461.1 hypothetical protein EZJ43_08050 [Pedobacter changchengzhani]